MDCFRSAIALALAACLCACSSSLPGAAQPVGFINQTHHTEQDLWAIWKAAQQSIARQVDLNPLQRTLYNAQPDLHPGDSRALDIQPRRFKVAAQPDVSSGQLLAQVGLSRSDPTGLISCPQPCNVQFAAAYSFHEPELTRYAASWEDEGDNFSTILEYEFENQILAALGYSLRWR
jgi:hypothetical protein